jgi:hypothetical protein
LHTPFLLRFCIIAVQLGVQVSLTPFSGLFVWQTETHVSKLQSGDVAGKGVGLGVGVGAGVDGTTGPAASAAGAPAAVRPRNSAKKTVRKKREKNRGTYDPHDRE